MQYTDIALAAVYKHTYNFTSLMPSEPKLNCSSTMSRVNELSSFGEMKYLGDCGTVEGTSLQRLAQLMFETSPLYYLQPSCETHSTH